MKKILLITTAVMLVFALSVSMYGCGSSPNELNALSSYAQTKLTYYAENQARYSAEYFADVYAKANIAAYTYESDRNEEDLQNIVRDLGLESIIVTNGKGDVVASQPKADIKHINDSDETEDFMGILKWIFPRYTSDPVKNDVGDYTISAGVRRVDDDGLIIVKISDDAYCKVTGETLAKECGANTVVIKDGAVLSSTLDAAEAGKKLDEVGLSSDDFAKESFGFKGGDTAYTCKAFTSGIYTVISAVVG